MSAHHGFSLLPPCPPQRGFAAGAEELFAHPRVAGWPSLSLAGPAGPQPGPHDSSAPDTTFCTHARMTCQDSSKRPASSLLKSSWGISKKKLGTLFRGSVKLLDAYLLRAFSGRSFPFRSGKLRCLVQPQWLCPQGWAGRREADESPADLLCGPSQTCPPVGADGASTEPHT